MWAGGEARLKITVWAFLPCGGVGRDGSGEGRKISRRPFSGLELGGELSERVDAHLS